MHGIWTIGLCCVLLTAVAFAQPSTRPADVTQSVRNSPPKRIVFIQLMGSHVMSEEIVRAIEKLSSDQYFNVITPNGQESISFSPQFLPANDVNKRRIREAIKPNTYVLSQSWEACMEAAARNRPDLIWVVGTVRTGVEDEQIATLKKLLAGYPTRVNTVGSLGTTAKAKRLLWRMAKETGGQCIDEQGNEIVEPTSPTKPPSSPRPATRPSRLVVD